MAGAGTVCSMCGDVGFPDKLFQCARCRYRFQHSYVTRDPAGVLSTTVISSLSRASSEHGVCVCVCAVSVCPCMSDRLVARVQILHELLRWRGARPGRRRHVRLVPERRRREGEVLVGGREAAGRRKPGVIHDDVELLRRKGWRRQARRRRAGERAAGDQGGRPKVQAAQGRLVLVCLGHPCRHPVLVVIA